MDFGKLITALTGGNLGDIEGKAGDLLQRLEKLGADVIGSNGNLVTMLVSLAEDFATMKQAVADAQAIVADLKGLHASVSATTYAPAPGVATGGTGAPAAAPTPVSVTSILQAAENVVQHVAPVLQAVASDPFAPKPLQRIAAAVEPRGGA